MRALVGFLLLALGSGASGQVAGPLRAGTIRLHDGWAISPLGNPVEVGTLPLAVVALPGRQAAVAICGYAENGVDIVNFATGARERLEMPKAWYGLAASRGG